MASRGLTARPIEISEPWVRDQVRTRLANFLHLFPGHTAVNVRDIAYGDWLELAQATDQYVADRKSRRRR